MQKNDIEIKNVYDIISESNEIKVGVSQFDSSQLSENFSYSFNFVNIDGEVSEIDEPM